MQIIFDKVQTNHVIGSTKIVVTTEDELFDDEMFGDVSYLEWWLKIYSNRTFMFQGQMQSDIILSELYKMIDMRFPDQSFMLETSEEDKTFSVHFTDDPEDDELF